MYCYIIPLFDLYFETHFLIVFHLNFNIFESQAHQVGIFYTRTEERQNFAFAGGKRRRNKRKMDFFPAFLPLSPMAKKCVFAACCTASTFTFPFFPFVILLLWLPGECGFLLV